MIKLKLSRRELVLAASAGLLAVLLIALWVSLGQQRDTRKDLTASVQRAQGVLEEDQRQSDLAALERQRGELHGALAGLSFPSVSSGEFAFSLFRWAGSNSVTITNFASQPGTVAIAGLNLATQKHSLTLLGEAPGLHGFLASATGSQFRPAVETLSLKRSLAAGIWEMGLTMTLYSQEASTG